MRTTIRFGVNENRERHVRACWKVHDDSSSPVRPSFDEDQIVDHDDEQGRSGPIMSDSQTRRFATRLFVDIAVVSGGPRLGDLEAGAVAAITSVRFSVVSGRLVCIAGALVIGRYMPELVRYRRGDGIPQTTTEPG